MKLNNLDIRFLTGMVEGAIANYDEHNTPIPAEKYLSFTIDIPENFAYVRDKNNFLKKEMRPSKTATITFSWIPESREVCVDSETNSYETRGESTEDHFTIVLGERIVKLQGLVEEILDKVTAN